MTMRVGVPKVGAMDPELRNSPVAEELDEESDTVRLQVPGEVLCWFNGQPYAHGACVQSGSQVLMCRDGVWVDIGSADPRNP
ncbi:MAG: hypothetical protein DIU71_13190 [Proteobacteria bacterium]|nr:MAG: hypothetical protein DIU71_13190 [Pseudomonadota bacterium]